MRRWITLIVLCGFALAVGAACSNKSGGSTKTATANSAVAPRATNTPTAPTNTPLPLTDTPAPPSAKVLQSVVETSLSLRSADVISVASQQLSQDQRSSLIIGLGSPNLTAPTGQARAAAFSEPERVSDGWRLGYVLTFDGQNIGYAEATLREEQGGWKILRTCRWDAETSVPVRPKPDPDRCWPQG